MHEPLKVSEIFQFLNFSTNLAIITRLIRRIVRSLADSLRFLSGNSLCTRRFSCWCSCRFANDAWTLDTTEPREATVRVAKSTNLNKALGRLERFELAVRLSCLDLAKARLWLFSSKRSRLEFPLAANDPVHRSSRSTRSSSSRFGLHGVICGNLQWIWRIAN